MVMPANHGLKIKKPWGMEFIFTTEDLPYTGKLLFIRANSRLSLQKHSAKTETLTLVSGQALIATGPTPDNLSQTPMQILKGYTIPNNTVHRLTATTDALIFETSTPERGITYRLEDDYHRTDETESDRNRLHGQKN